MGIFLTLIINQLWHISFLFFPYSSLTSFFDTEPFLISCMQKTNQGIQVLNFIYKGALEVYKLRIKKQSSVEIVSWHACDMIRVTSPSEHKFTARDCISQRLFWKVMALKLAAISHFPPLWEPVHQIISLKEIPVL